MMKKNILVIVEGIKTESKFFKTLLQSFEESFEIYCLGTNIYSLYKSMKEIDFNADIKDVLIELHPEHKDVLLNNFAYTYLIFDCDAHHPKKEDTRSLKEIVLDNIKKLEEMTDYFTNETDPTIGKLYINYPMMESFRDCNSFFDEEYKDSIVEIENIHNYKKIVSEKKLHSSHIEHFKKENFISLIIQNLYKLNNLENGSWSKPNYLDYLKMSNSNNILLIQKEYVINKEIISVLNTSLFLILDYFGNKNKFYDNLIVQSN